MRKDGRPLAMPRLAHATHLPASAAALGPRQRLTRLRGPTGPAAAADGSCQARTRPPLLQQSRRRLEPRVPAAAPPLLRQSQRQRRQEPVPAAAPAGRFAGMPAASGCWAARPGPPAAGRGSWTAQPPLPGLPFVPPCADRCAVAGGASIRGCSGRWPTLQAAPFLAAQGL